MKRIKLCIVMPTHWSSAMGGAEYQVKCLIQRLMRYDRFEIYFLARDIGEIENTKNIKLINITNRNFISKYGYFLDSIHLFSQLKKIEPDIIYQRVGCAYTGVTAYYAKKSGCRTVWHISSDSDVRKNHIPIIRKPHIWIERKILTYGINNIEAIIAQTNHQKSLLYKTFGRKTSQIVKNFHPIPDKTIIEKPKEPIKILWVANFKQIKRPDIFVKLANDIFEIIGMKAQFTMIGRPATWDMKWQSSLEQNIKKVPNLEYLGELSIEKVNQHIGSSHLFVNTSEEEGFPNTFIQSWMRYVPVISLKVDPDGIIEKNGIGALAGNYERLKELVLSFVNNPSRMIQAGIAARDYAEKNHSLDNADVLCNMLIDLHHE